MCVQLSQPVGLLYICSDTQIQMAEAKFVQWVKQRGGYVSPKIALFHDTGSGDRTVYANEALEEGEQLLLVAVQDTLHLSMPPKDATKQQEEPGCIAAATAFLSAPEQQHLSPFIRTSLLLLAEMARGTESAFAPYIENLPSKSDCLLHWGEEDLALLAGTSIEPQGRALEQLFNEVVAPVLAAAPQLYPAPYNTFQHFLRAADMTQTRAFHMVAENWVTGVSQENTEELYLIPAIDMLNHSTDPEQRNTQLLRFSAGTPLPLEGGKTLSSKGFFTMKADRSIAAGEPILHTYGDLSDAQLLQTYGFVQQLGQANPHNYALMPFGTLVEAVQMLPEEAVELTEGTLAMKVQYLTKSGLLQTAAPRDTQFVLSCNEPLPDELLTTLQVLLLQEEELQELQQDAEPAAAGGSTSGAGSSKAGSSIAAPAARLSLGTALLREEFGELVAGALVSAMSLAVSRYPTSAAEDQEVLDSQDSGSRAWRAAFVAKGEKAVLAAAKVAALELLFAAEGSDEDEDEEEDEEEDVDSELDEAEAAALAAAMASAAAAATGTAQKQCKRQRAAPAAAGAGSGSRGKKQKHGLGYMSQDDIEAAGAEEGEEEAAGNGKQQARHKHHHHRRHKHKKDHRSHFGAMTGPSEEDVWQSDDSEKVGYSESEGEQEPEGAAAAAAAAAAGSKRKRRPRQPTGDPQDPHRYEVAADGAVREVHGHMVGPDEADLVESDDSDKVGYA